MIPPMTASPDALRPFELIRSAVPITAERACLFAGSMAPLSDPARAALVAYAELCQRDPVRAYREVPPVETALLREHVGKFIAAAAGTVAILDTTSRGNNLAAQMVPAPAGTNVVVDATTYPSALLPWLLPERRGVELRTVPADGEVPVVERIAELVDESTVAISVSHVCRHTGFRHDLRALSELAHAHGALLLVDAAQSVGAVPVDVVADGIDMLSFGAMKWLMGRPGLAFFYVRPGLLEELRPPHVGPTGAHVVDGVLRWADGGLRHELSSVAWDGLAATRVALELLSLAPPRAVERHVVELSGRLVEGLVARGFSVPTPRDPARRAGVVAFFCDRPLELRLHLRELGVDIWSWERDGRVRVDPHVYNTASDVERFLGGIDAFAQKPDR
jgi:selenocysteine lyase/cysteine desulfurase